MTATTAQLCCSVQHLCAASSFSVGNYLFPVVIIILQHTAAPISNASHIHLQWLCSQGLSAVPSLPDTGVKGTDLLQQGWRQGINDRKEMKEWKMDRAGWAQQWKMDALSRSAPTHTPTYAHIFCPSACLVKGRSAGKNLPSVNDGYLSYSGAVCTDSLERRFRCCQKGASSLSVPIRVAQWQSDIIRPSLVATGLTLTQPGGISSALTSSSFHVNINFVWFSEQ